MRDIPALPTPRLDVRDLRVVMALAKTGTTARAAEMLHLTQPAVSRALASVEGKLGVRLFDRSARGLTPTAACERMIDGAAQLLNELRDLERRVVTPLEAIRIRLVCQCYTAYHWLPSVLVGMRRALPGLDVKLAVEHTGDPVAGLEAGHVDVALLTTGEVPRDRIRECPLFDDEIVFVVARSHPLASRKSITRADLRAHPILTSPTPHAESRWFMNRVFGRTRPALRFERFPLTEAILDVARAGMGIAILSEWIAAPHLGRGDLVAKRLATGPIRRPWRLAWRSEVGPAAARLRDALASTVPSARLAG